MARLTEQEMELIRRAKFAARIHSIDNHDVLAEAQRMKSETLARLLGQAAHWIARTTGLTMLGRLLSRSVILPLRRAAQNRRTTASLRQLDDRLLSDIGLRREDIGHLAVQTSQAPTPAAERRVPGALRTRIRRWRTQRELEALTDQVLSDIGVRRSEIPALVNQLYGQNDGPAEGATMAPAPSTGVHLPAALEVVLGVLKVRIRRRRTRRELQALSDHVLNDIGVRRSEIRALANQLHGHGSDGADSAAVKATPSAGARVLPGPGNAKANTLADLGLAFLPPDVVARLMKHAA